ncbi:Rap/Ran GTPase-activating protein, putative [Entamoeba histolytica HM-1:IMSS-B]|uniref:Rap-GAP domain-containing protein n=4 Tax=Entamoeba histolytica TaxID=5759 RepID=C4LZD2_ENTH1|nr:uncharacterized protein EHI_137690 [Entamoeba histolytica HM-1:IMSS]EAL48652.2 hypothetical protein, conserved domain containing [Entamoeba histolytica HM-1:IMSS]EMH76478.1 Rap/Ran GTPase-activating protein, putative [Entamoeba histolytica HM-1:IMSS-B]ENY60830.1 rap GTPase-activating protein, putative [Entamoeba histolytica HM-1:IMSS-A]GAT94215.1 rap ran GTPase-activating protein putative [Entamoeba histolytica]|eukprot:XP_654038.2 uncharacterized protein EHI_137690 [Entamoeba histolytica HM-1:IMSS]
MFKSKFSKKRNSTSSEPLTCSDSKIPTISSPTEKPKKKRKASVGSVFKGIGEALTFEKEKTAEEKAKEEQENLMVLQLFKQNLECFEKSSEPVLVCESLTGYKRMNKAKITKRDLVFAMCGEPVYKGTIKIDCWSTLKMPIDSYSTKQKRKCLIPLDIEKDGYCIECDESSIEQKTALKNMTIVDFESEFPFYKEFFYRNPNVKHYLSKEENVICSIQRFKEVSRCILRNNKGVIRCLIGKEESEKPQCYDKFFNEPKNVICLDNTPELDDALFEMENKSIITHFKFGVIYVKPNQNDENKIFTTSAKDCSPAFWKFLDLIGNKIELNGWTGYRGGLDVKSGSTGTHSYISHTHNFEIMFHVSPLIPLLQDDGQGLERKRHVGNDVVVLIFKEQSNQNDTFDPRILTSHFNSIFIVVTPDKPTIDNIHYKVTVCAKAEINSFPPYLNETGTYFHDDIFRDFILRKLINGERTAMFSPTFRLNYKKTIKEEIKNINEQFYKQDLFAVLK